MLLPHAGYGQLTVEDNGGCFMPEDTWSHIGSVAGYNIYEAPLTCCGFNSRVQWSIDNNRWEIVVDADDTGLFDYVFHTNTTNTSPNPPALGNGTWSSTGYSCGQLTQFSGAYTTAAAVAPVITGNPPNRTICAGSNTTFNISATDATSYQWQVNTGSGFNNISNSAPYSGATTTTLTITGATGGMSGYQYRAIATGSGSATSNSAALTVSNVSASSAQTNVSCFGGSNGTATVSPSGGITPYTYSWAPSGGTGSVATGLVAGTYTVSVTDAIGCQATRNFTITQPAAAVSGSTVVTNVSCNNGSNGTINLTPTGGTGPYTFVWNNGATAEDRTGLVAGTYTVTITDANGCTGTVGATVNQPAAPVSGTTFVTNVSCNGGSNGTINLTPTGGTGPYTFVWNNGATTEDRIGLVAGTYTVTITDVNGCTGTVSATVNQPAAPVSGTTVVTSVSCNNGSNGTINLTPTGGTGPYTFNWAGGPTTEDRTGLAAGTYTVTITDTNGCTGTVSATVIQPNALVVSAASQTNIACNGGSSGAASVNAAMGGSGGYTYDWSPGTPTGDGTTSVTGLSAGTYTVIVTDVNGCTASQSFTITQHDTLVASAASQTNIACIGGATGAATVSATGGTPGYTYSWSPSGGTAATASGLAAGTYVVTVTDANGCEATQSFTITQSTAAVSGTTVVTSVSCNNGSNGTINLTPTGGTGPYTFNWASGPITEDRTGLAAGTYTVTITDTNGCTGTVSATVTQPNALVVSAASQTNIACNGGSSGAASVNAATGGSGGYTYDWSPGTPTGDGTTSVTGLSAGTYTVIVTDVNGCTASQSFTITQPATLVASAASQTNIACNGGATGAATVSATGGTPGYTYSWSPSGGTAATASGLSAGAYIVTVTDANACEASQSFTITQPAALVASTVSQTNIACNGGATGAATVSATGGTPGYTYSWSPSGGTAATASGLSAGTYVVTITDANGCEATQSVTITEPAAIVATATVDTNASCNGGSNGAATVAVTGGTAPYTYLWSNAATTASVTGLAAGIYDVTVTDANACTAIASVTVTEPATILITVQPQNETIAAGAIAVFTVVAANVDSYQWQVSIDGTNWSDVNNGGTIPIYSGADTNTLTLTENPASFDGYSFRVILTNGTDCYIASDIAVLTVNGILLAVNDDFSDVTINEGVGGIAGDVTTNDLFNGVPVLDTDVIITVVNDGGLTGVTIDSDGNFNVPASAIQETYNVSYSICEVGNAANCNQADVLVVVQPPLKGISLKLYPSPASTEVFVNIDNISAHKNVKVTVYDMNGRKFSEQAVTNELHRVDVSALEFGVYLFDITSDIGQTTKMIIKN